jgi:hypothetical protein
MGYCSYVWKLKLLPWEDGTESNVIYEIIMSYRKKINLSFSKSGTSKCKSESDDDNDKWNGSTAANWAIQTQTHWTTHRWVCMSISTQYILSHVWGSMTNNNRFWIGRLDLLIPYTMNLYLQAIQHYHWFIQFTVHHYICTRTLNLH